MFWGRGAEISAGGRPYRRYEHPPMPWAEFAATYRRTRQAYQDHESAKADLKKLVPEDAREAVRHGLRPNDPNPGP